MTASFLVLACLTGAPLDLASVLEEVSGHAPALQVQAATVEVNRSRAELAGAWEDPTLTVMAEDVPFPGATGADPAMLTYRLSQPLNVFGRRGLAKAAGEAEWAGEQARLERTRWDVRAEAVRLFYDLWMNQEMDALLGRQLALLADMRQAALARYGAGMATGHHEVLRAEAETAVMQAERTSLGEEWRAMEAMLNTLRGRPREEPIAAVALPEPSELPLEDVLQERVAAQPDLVAMRAMTTAMEARRDLAERTYWPMVMVEAQYQQRLGAMPDAFGGALVLSVPLWWWDRQDHEVAMAEAMVQQSQRARDAMERMTRAELSMALSRTRAAARQLRALEQTALPSLAQTVASARAAYVGGQGDFLQLLEAAMADLAVEGERIRAVSRLGVARFELSRLLGAPLGTAP